MKMTEPYNLGLLALISAAGEISYDYFLLGTL